MVAERDAGVFASWVGSTGRHIVEPKRRVATTGEGKASEAHDGLFASSLRP